MKLQLANGNAQACFAHLGPVTFESFHFGMNYLEKIVFCAVWNKTQQEVGTLRGEKEPVNRNCTYKILYSEKK